MLKVSLGSFFTIIFLLVLLFFLFFQYFGLHSYDEIASSKLKMDILIIKDEVQEFISKEGRFPKSIVEIESSSQKKIPKCALTDKSYIFKISGKNMTLVCGDSYESINIKI
ncbi:hypothetical protein N474_25475 [Pseudoalteromonas luteoviolacea CPMOR-2]|uniref:Type II secretion system protein GspG C-terminal domain-containing protein n=1 Tax=Pseudoalteromonas luteoviolacea DSM 6061 TaxID=1365250 RepID=A0A166ZHW2_9GAMM|nr:hypothetical protein [Pseudoalteromonas luteoviolacea]KZN44332.1 hypothetical protein N475_25965 [Pseudoalteromonas luteoviolacea DSM 6061]KZN58567.1 hypothetical protein N474_25475 [Pseudoalteromonas luteoviolacea CPMOR-2]